jgi:hypothetical protein
LKGLSLQNLGGLLLSNLTAGNQLRLWQTLVRAAPPAGLQPRPQPAPAFNQPAEPRPRRAPPQPSLGSSPSPLSPSCRPQAPLDVTTVAPFSSYGPTSDGRLKPDLVAPGWCAGLSSADLRCTACSGSRRHCLRPRTRGKACHCSSIRRSITSAATDTGRTLGASPSLPPATACTRSGGSSTHGAANLPADPHAG